MRCDRLGHGVFSFWLFAILGFVTRENTPLLLSRQSTTFGYISTAKAFRYYGEGHAQGKVVITVAHNNK
jgi:hypothetical protein